jgi:tryptophan 2,3-dioxygenase
LDPKVPPAEHAASVDLSDEPVHWNLGDSQTYGEYLHLDLLLGAQQPLTAEHSEMLFIIVHQVSELWMRLLRHELLSVMECVRRDDLDPSFKMLSRIGSVQAQLLAVWEVLATMTPFDYSAFRNALGRSSGFQSQQYRLIEFLLGNKNAAVIEVYRPEAQATRNSRGSWPHRVFTTRCCACPRAAATGAAGRRCCAISPFPMKPASR